MTDKKTKISPYKTDNLSRRNVLLSGGSFIAAAGALGLSSHVKIPFLKNLKNGIVPLAQAQTSIDESAFDKGQAMYGKGQLTLLNDRPLNMETPPHLLDAKVTPAEHFFVRNNGIPPENTEAENWTLTIDGLVDTPVTYTIAELKSRFETHTLQLQIECGGNGRKFYEPGASGNQWTFGAIGCAQWTGVRLKDVLEAANIQEGAVYTAHFGADTHLSGDSKKRPISRGVPISKAMEEHNLIAWAMNGQDIPIINGAPLRLVVPGWPGSCSQKWLTKITVRDQVHDGAKMTGKAYRVPEYSVAPGTAVPDSDMQIIESMPVKSLITSPKTGTKVKPNKSFEVRGHAWAGDLDVKSVDVSIDFGASWQPAQLDSPVNKYAWQHWRANITLPEAGYYEVWARATDSQGMMQPPMTPGWNPKGYLNNMQHRVAIFGVTA